MQTLNIRDIWKNLRLYEKIILAWFILSLLAIIFLTIASGSAGFRFLIVYFAVWILLVGGYFYTYRSSIVLHLQSMRLHPFAKFMILGILVILVEETVAAFSNALAEGFKISVFLMRVPQFQISTLTAFIPFFLGWYFMQKYFRFSLRDALILAGASGAVVETFGTFANLQFGSIFLIYPSAVLGYAIIMFVPLASMKIENAGSHKLHAYALGLIVPSVLEFLGAFIGVTVLLQHAPYLVMPSLSSNAASGIQLSPLCGFGHSCISKNETVSLIGPGTYNSIYLGNQNLIKGTPGYTRSFYKNSSLSAAWFVFYFAKSNKTLMFENILKTSNPVSLYEKGLTNTSGSFTVANATINGMTYSYWGNGGNFSSTGLLGYKNDEVVYVILPTKFVPQNSLALIISNDLP